VEGKAEKSTFTRIHSGSFQIEGAMKADEVYHETGRFIFAL
jgi:hypothetical protein